MLIQVCDRCGIVGPLKPAFGKTAELCAGCVARFDEWWAAGKRKASGRRDHRRTPPGESFKLAADLIARHGHVSPEDYGRATARSRRDAYYSLRHLARSGLLRGGAQPNGDVCFYLATQEVSHAAE